MANVLNNVQTLYYSLDLFLDGDFSNPYNGALRLHRRRADKLKARL